MRGMTGWETTVLDGHSPRQFLVGAPDAALVPDARTQSVAAQREVPVWAAAASAAVETAASSLWVA